MKDLSPTKIALFACSALGICLLVARWFITGELASFFLTLVLATMFLLRWRLARWGATTALDVTVCLVLWPGALALPLFWAMYHRMYVAGLALLYFVYARDWVAGSVAALGALAGLFLGLWERERGLRWRARDTEAGRYYELEAVQRDLLSATAQVERMTLVSERARIAREIHDNAGHEIVAAYITMQTLRAGVQEGEALDTDALVLFDAALERLDAGAQRIREAVHNLAPVTALGVESLEEVCRRFPHGPVVFTVFGDTAHVPVYVWNALESCLNEALTNIAKHARAHRVSVTIDATAQLVRLCVENDGVHPFHGSDKKERTRPFAMGSGLRNLRHRMATIGGNLAVDPGETFKVICVAPIRESEK